MPCQPSVLIVTLPCQPKANRRSYIPCDGLLTCLFLIISRIHIYSRLDLLLNILKPIQSLLLLLLLWTTQASLAFAARRTPVISQHEVLGRLGNVAEAMLREFYQVQKIN